LSLYITERLHAKPSALASFFIAGVVAEIIMMIVIGRISDRFGRRPALIVAFVALPFRLVGYIFAPTPQWAAGVQAMHGLNYGIIGTVGITLVNDCAEEHRRGTEQARLGVTASLATAVGQWICGFILQKAGFNEMFIAMTGLSLIGIALMIFRVPETHPRFRRADISAGL
jgi:MFS family permease